MNFTRIGDLVEIDGKFRVEAGPRRMTGKADKATLDNAVTASHYQVGGFDAAVPPKVIEAGKDFEYLDWLGFQSEDQIKAFHAYRLDDKTEAELEDVDQDQPGAELTIWREIGVYDTEEEAISACLSTASA